MDPKWIKVAKAEIGTAEKPGKVHNDRILEYFGAAGHSEVKNDETAWCSAFANFCIEQAGIRGTMSLAARSWLRWGKKVKPTPGCIMIFSRGTSAWQGHVAFLIEETPTTYRVLGGNQQNRVSIASYPKERLLDARWPETLGNSKTVKAQIMTAVPATMAVIGEQATEWQFIAQDWAQYFEWAQKVALCLAVAGGIATLYFKVKSIREKGA